jgi:hypothetical protein
MGIENQNLPIPEENADYALGGVDDMLYEDPAYMRRISEGIDADFEQAFGHERHSYTVEQPTPVAQVAAPAPEAPVAPQTRQKRMEHVRQQLAGQVNSYGDLAKGRGLVGDHLKPDANKFGLVAMADKASDSSGAGEPAAPEATTAVTAEDVLKLKAQLDSQSRPPNGSSKASTESAASTTPDTAKNAGSPKAGESKNAAQTTSEASTTTEPEPTANEDKTKAAQRQSPVPAPPKKPLTARPPAHGGSNGRGSDSKAAKGTKSSSAGAPVQATQTSSGAQGAGPQLPGGSNAVGPRLQRRTPDTATAPSPAAANTAPDGANGGSAEPDTGTSGSGTPEAAQQPAATIVRLSRSREMAGLVDHQIGVYEAPSSQEVTKSRSAVATRRKEGRNSPNEDAFEIEPGTSAIADGVGRRKGAALTARNVVGRFANHWNDYEREGSHINQGFVEADLRDWASQVRVALDGKPSTTFVGTRTYRDSETGDVRASGITVGDSRWMVLDLNAPSGADIVFVSPEQSGFAKVGDEPIFPRGKQTDPDVPYNTVVEPNVINNNFGNQETKRVDDDITTVTLPERYAKLEYTDGLGGDKPEERVDVDEIAWVVREAANQGMSPQEIAVLLVELAKKNDDCTVVVELGTTIPASPATPKAADSPWADIFDLNNGQPDTDTNSSSSGTADSPTTPTPAPTPPLPTRRPSYVLNPRGTSPAPAGGNASPRLPRPSAAPTPDHLAAYARRFGLESTNSATTPPSAEMAAETSANIGTMMGVRRAGRHRRESGVSRRVNGLRTSASELWEKFKGVEMSIGQPAFVAETQRRVSEFLDERRDRRENMSDGERRERSERRRKLMVAGGLGSAAVGVIAGGIYGLTQIDSANEGRGVPPAPSVSASATPGSQHQSASPEQTTPTPSASEASKTPEPSASSTAPETSPSSSASPEASSPAASPSESTGQDDRQGSERDNARPDQDTQNPNTVRPYVEDGYRITTNEDGSYTIRLSHSGTTLWGATQKALVKEGVQASDPTIYNLVGQGLESQGKTWEDAGSIHQGSTVTVKLGPGGPQITDLRLR